MNIDFSKVEKLVEQGYISRKEHPVLPLYIFNYTNRTQFEGFWTTETMACRGLITTKDYEIVARPFQKFFNLEQNQGPLPDGEFEVYEKMDGSLIIAVLYKGHMVVATRGSFTSNQAAHAEKLLREKYGWIEDYMVSGITYLMEVIYSENRIVVDYGDRDELTLLAVINTESEKEYNLDDIPVGQIPKVKRYDGITDFQQLTEKSEDNREGYVIRWKNGFRLKMKFEEYKRLHRLVFGVNSKTIWEMLKEGKSLNELLDRVPDEFYNWVKETAGNLQQQYAEIDRECISEYHRINREVKDMELLPDKRRKAFAKKAIKIQYSGILFSMLDLHDHSQLIWKRIRPKAEKPYRVVSEDVA